MATQSGSQAVPKEQAFFSEEATRHILLRIANVFSDAELCDATFVVGDADEKEEIMAPSQIMALSSPYFKGLFYPPKEDKRREVEGMQPKTFRKILDYLFRGRVPLGSIEDAWKVKVAGRTFELKELEELCTKFLKYRIDSKNMVHFLKNTTKYDTPDLREVVISRFVKDATNGFQNDQVLDLSEQELLDIMEKKPEIQAKTVMEVLIRWARKCFQAEIKAKQEAPVKDKELVTEKPNEEEKSDAPIENMEKDKEATEKKEKEEEATDIDNATETKDEKGEESEAQHKEDKKEETPAIEEDFIAPLEKLVKNVTWNNNDAEYYLKEIHQKKVLSEENKNCAMAQMLQAFVDLKPFSQPSPAAARMGPKSAQQQRASPQAKNQKGPQKRTSDGDCDVVMERISKVAKPANARVKEEDDIIL